MTIGAFVDNVSINVPEHVVATAKSRHLLGNPDREHLRNSSHHLFHSIPVDLVKVVTMNQINSIW